MSDELRASIVRALETMAVDLVAGRYDDPHVGFLILVHPDREPHIVVLSPQGADSFEYITTATRDTEAKAPSGLFFTRADLEDATRALDAARLAIVCGIPDVQGYVRDTRTRTSDRNATALLERATYDAQHSARCPFCQRKFTPRGLPLHQARNRHCKRLQSAAQTEVSA